MRMTIAEMMASWPIRSRLRSARVDCEPLPPKTRSRKADSPLAVCTTRASLKTRKKARGHDQGFQPVLAQVAAADGREHELDHELD
jgi:hypothetical protein